MCDNARPVFDMLCTSAVGIPKGDHHFEDLLRCIEEQQPWPFPRGSAVKGKLVPNGSSLRVVVDYTEMRLGATWPSVQSILNTKIAELQAEASVQ